MGRARAFALVEVVVVVGLFAVLLAACVPMLREERRQVSIKADLNSMRLIGQASAMYSSANAGRLFTFSWEPGQVPVTPNKQLALACANLNPFNASNLLRAPTLQLLDLVTYGFKDERLPPVESVVPVNTVPHISYNNLVLSKFMGATLPSELFVSSGDKHRKYWLNHLDKYLDDPAGSPARPPSASTDFVDLWRYPFSSSYQVGVSHFSNDTGHTGSPPSPSTSERATNHRTWYMPNQPGILRSRNASEVAFPSLKVTMFDEFDRYSPNEQSFFALPGASNIMNFYDGHAARLAIADANYGFFPNQPDRGADTPDQPSKFYVYSPISWWDPPGAMGTAFVPVRYDQTRGGLQGIDYPGMRPNRGAAFSGVSAR